MKDMVELSMCPFFSDISKDRLSDIAKMSMIQAYKKDNVIFHKNEPARNLYGVIQGEVELSIVFQEEIITRDIKHEEYIRTHIQKLEKPIIIEHVKNGDIFGWSALVEPEKMTATARCCCDTEIYSIPSSGLRELFKKDPELGYILSSRINVLISKRLNSRTERLIDTWCDLFEATGISA